MGMKDVTTGGHPHKIKGTVTEPRVVGNQTKVKGAITSTRWEDNKVVKGEIGQIRKT